MADDKSSQDIFSTGFTGVWISAEVLKMGGLSLHQKAVLSLVGAFNTKGTRLSNANWGSILGISDRHFRRILADLKNRKLLAECGTNGHRVLRLTPDIMSTLKPLGEDEMSGQEPEKRTRCPGGRTRRSTINKLNKKPIKNTYPPAFELFWKTYPKRRGRKSGKKDALKEWQKINPDKGLAGKIMAALEIQKKHEDWTKEDGQYVPDANRWLKRSLWEDEVESAVATSGKAKSGTYTGAETKVSYDGISTQF